MSDLIPDRATSAGTSRYCERFAAQTADGHFREQRGVALASVGLGTYLGAEDAATDKGYEAAVLRALELGSNVIDTAVNYRCQQSERAIGRALRAAIDAGTVRREEVLVATKGGFVPFDGARPRDVGAYIEEKFIRPGILPRDALVGGCHSLAPSYLEDQIETSRRNLGLETIDVYYLHNPEMQLGEVPRADFLARIRAAFEVLERACGEGRIGAYGTATWDGYRKPPGDPERLDLGEILEAARDAGGPEHHFGFVQLPYNLAMTEALTKETQVVGGKPATFLDAAEEAGIYVMTSASILQGRLAKQLPDELRQMLGVNATDAQRSIQFVRSTPGVGTALVGMKTVAHVEENLAIAKVPPLQPDRVAALFSGTNAS